MPRAMKDPLSGVWSGVYHHAGWEQPHSFSFAIEEIEGHLRGKGTDDRGTYFLRGDRGTEQAVSWRQTYLGGSVIHFQGVVAMARIEGEWAVPENQRGFWLAVWRRFAELYQAFRPTRDDWFLVMLGGPLAIALCMIAFWLVLPIIAVPVAVLEVFRFHHAAHEGDFVVECVGAAADRGVR